MTMTTSMTAAAAEGGGGGLAARHPHPRDADIEFFEEGHIYDVKGDRSFVSSTTFVHSFFGEFDADSVIAGMRKGRRWAESKYFGMTDEAIKTMWRENGEDASARGTLLHACIEHFYNGWPLPLAAPDDAAPDEYARLFLPFHAKATRRGLVPYRSEWCIYDEAFRVTGSVDMLYQVDANDPDRLVIYDWKRSKELKMAAFRGETGTGPLEALPDCNYWHYAMQLNLYRLILQRNYGKTSVGMFLVVLHPHQSVALEKEVPLLEDEVLAMLATRHAPSSDAVEHCGVRE